ncbi:sodium-dependent transporter [Rheinheimera nanhaiensis]|uniref:Neurotransmitter:Na+ symporter, NSS family n=1 Tax=Rheinheimera nanhaiensis E407-8 TaxID=562729 RepID=I1DX35_9GAMM|nr:sodium-dependent transporter [Rheinheimera nanhaiensis]GAB58613.1 neurotransmitter:Na+ symporter, NSS family [Rheinheimera nanhaiensis E407-8]
MKREQFSSSLGFVLAAAGSAVGIGNLVAFPVMASKNGGAAFLIMYAFFVFFICLPVMLAEMSLGRHTRQNPLGAYTEIGQNRAWRTVGWLSVLTPFMIGVFYLVITVWIFGYLAKSVMGQLTELAAPDSFGSFINSNELFIYMAIVIGLTFAILQGGVKQGIEKAARVLMPMLFIMLIALVIYVFTLDNAMLGVKFFLVPEFDKLTGKVLNGALAQAFFSLSLAMGILITYGSYIQKNNDIVHAGKMVAALSLLVAACSGLLILPAVFSFNPDIQLSELSESSIGMIFMFLPKIFLALQADIGYFGASFVASFFFLLVFFAALTSLVSIIEVPVASLMDGKGVSRRKALYTLGAVMITLAVVCALSFGRVELFSSLTSYGLNAEGQPIVKSFFDLVYDIFYETILPLNGLLLCLFVIYRWKKHNFDAEISQGNATFAGSLLQKYVNFSLGTFIPFILAVIFVNTVSTIFFGKNLLF